MPNIKSAKKRLRTGEKSWQANMAVRTRVATFRRRLMEAVAAKDAEKGNEVYRTYCSVLDKAAKKGVIKKNTATRRKSRAAERLRSLSAPEAK